MFTDYQRLRLQPRQAQTITRGTIKACSNRATDTGETHSNHADAKTRARDPRRCQTHAQTHAET
jgi:hypothetical protein